MPSLIRRAYIYLWHSGTCGYGSLLLFLFGVSDIIDPPVDCDFLGQTNHTAIFSFVLGALSICSTHNGYLGMTLPRSTVLFRLPTFSAYLLVVCGWGTVTS